MALSEVDELFHINISSVNTSVISNETLYMYEITDNLFLKYYYIHIIIGVVIVLCNLTVVLSSGLILQTGQQSKTTCILLGNVSLADTGIGIYTIFFNEVTELPYDGTMCAFVTGFQMCQIFVSIISVLLITVDRYFFILHGLYYHRYFNTSRVRISIIVTWIIGIILAFLPAVGWIRDYTEEIYICSNANLYPRSLLLFIELLEVLALMAIAIFYSIILINALRNIKKVLERRLKNNNGQLNKDISLATVNTSKESNRSNDCSEPKRTSFSTSGDVLSSNLDVTPKSSMVTDAQLEPKPNSEHKVIIHRVNHTDSVSSINSIDLSTSCSSSSNPPNRERDQKVIKKKSKSKKPSMLRATIVVSLTSGSIIITWFPYLILIIMYELMCYTDSERTECLKLDLISVPLIPLAYFNSILNPIIYAYWHKGFNRSIKKYYRGVISRLCSKN